MLKVRVVGSTSEMRARASERTSRVCCAAARHGNRRRRVGSSLIFLMNSHSVCKLEMDERRE